MTYDILSVLCGGQGFEAPNVPGSHSIVEWDNRRNTLTPCQCYQKLLENSTADVLLYAHDDVSIFDTGWLIRVLRLFENPACVTVGLGGALSLGHPYLYRRPYRIQDMARGGYRSNQSDWSTHGEREMGDCRVAVVDAFFMAVRRDWLLSVGGWPVEHISHHGIDLWAACMAARTGKETWIAGASVTHHGGGSSTKPAYAEAKWLQGGTLESDHQQPHKWLYREFRDILPLGVR